MNRICPQSLDAECSDRSARADVLLRKESDEEEDEEEEEEEGNGTDDEGDDEEEEEDDAGYSVQLYRFYEW